MKSNNKNNAASNVAAMNRALAEYYSMGIDPSLTCIGVAIVSNKDKLIVPGYVRRPKGTSKLSNTEAMETMYEAFRSEFSGIGAEILSRVLSVSVEYPFLRSGPKCDPQATIKLAMFAGMVSSLISERYMELGLPSPKIVYATYSEVKEVLGVHPKVCRASGKNIVGHIVGTVYGIKAELDEAGGTDGGYVSRTRPDVINQDTLDAMAHAYYAVRTVDVSDVLGRRAPNNE